jgi:glycosyltransferase involved in cell wall biosynthesis
VRHARIDTFARTPEVLWRSVEPRDLAAPGRRDVVHTHAGVPTLAWCAGGSSYAPATRRAHVQLGRGAAGWMNDMDLAGFTRGGSRGLLGEAYERLLLDGRRRSTTGSRTSHGASDLARIDRGARGAAVPPPDVRIGFVGRVEPLKGQLDLITALCVRAASGAGGAAGVRRSRRRRRYRGALPRPKWPARARDAVTWHGTWRDVAGRLP